MTDGDSRLPGLNHGGIAMSCNPPLTFHCARPGVDAALTGVTVAVKNVAAEGRLDERAVCWRYLYRARTTVIVYLIVKVIVSPLVHLPSSFIA